MNMEDYADHLKDIAEQTITSIPEKWSKVIITSEIDSECASIEGTVIDSIGNDTTIDFDSSSIDIIIDRFLTIRIAEQERTNKAPWSKAYFTFDKNGKFVIEFEYD